MPSAPTVSILIPTFRYVRFLPEAIDSVLRQSFHDFELIVSDDASGDGSAELISAYAQMDPRVTVYVQRRNLGMVANWNWCLARAQGRYVKFMFGDDKFVTPDALGLMVERLDQEPRAVLVASARAILDQDSEQRDVWNELGAEGYHEGADVVTRCFAQDRNLVGEPSAVLFRREAARRGFDPSLRQLVDEEMWFHLLGDGGLVYLPRAICAFRQHAEQQTAVNRQAGIAAIENVRLMARYFPRYAAAFGLGEHSFAMRRRLYRLLYYCRKDAPNSEVATAAVQILRARLPAPWKLLCWIVHRASRPFENLVRALRKQPLPLALPQPERALPRRKWA